MSAAVFGLYPTRELVPGQRLSAGATLALQRPIDVEGVVRFRATVWLPVPAGIAGAASLRLQPGQLAIRFEPARFEVPLSDRGWFTSVEPVDAARLRIEFAWPAEVAAVQRRPGRSHHAISLFRADGAAVAAEAAQTGSTGADLDPPWVGSPLVLKVGDAIAGLAERVAFGGTGAVVVQPRAAAIAIAIGSGAADKGEILLGTARSAISALTLAGRPSSPRLSLFCEAAGASTLLWQALLPGEHATALLPQAALDVEWAGALEQLRSIGTAAERLRLEIESDAPCRVRIEALALGLRAGFELLPEPRAIGFDGTRVESLPLALTLPADMTPQALRIGGRLVAEAQADGGAAGAPASHLGALLHADRMLLQPVDLPAPMSLAGLAFDWLPLSSDLVLRIRVLADGGDRPALRALAEVTAPFPTPQAGRLVARWPAVDLQAQTLWIEATPIEGAGVWPFEEQGADASRAGWTETLAATPQRDGLPNGVRHRLLEASAEVAEARPVAVRLDAHLLAPTLPAGRFEIDVPASLLPLLASRPLLFEASVRASLSIESARLETAF